MDNNMHLYWNKWYKKNNIPNFPSSFAEFCLNYIDQGSNIIDLGCGNGRDSFFFGHKGHNILGIDYSETAISHNNKINIMSNVNFNVADFSNMGNLGRFSCAYSRFSLHAVDLSTERVLIKWCSKNLLPKGIICVEARSIKDPLLKSGKRLSYYENYTTHYRRFLEYNETKQYLEKAGFNIIFSIESDNLSTFKNDNPVVIRIVAEKK